MSLDYILRAIRKPLKDLKEGVLKSDLHFWKITLAAEWRIRPNTRTFSSWFTKNGFTCQDPTAQTFGTTLQLHFEPVHSVTYLALVHITLEFFGILYWGCDVIYKFQLPSPDTRGREGWLPFWTSRASSIFSFNYITLYFLITLHLKHIPIFY